MVSLKHKKTILGGIVVLIIILLIGGKIMIDRLMKVPSDSQIKYETVLGGLAKIAVAIEEYKRDKSTYPINLSLLVPDYLESIPKTPYTAEGDDYTYKKSYYYDLKNGSSYEITFWLKSGWLPGRGWWYEECNYPAKNKWYPANISVWCAESDFHLIENYLEEERKNIN